MFFDELVEATGARYVESEEFMKKVKRLNVGDDDGGQEKQYLSQIPPAAGY